LSHEPGLQRDGESEPTIMTFLAPLFFAGLLAVGLPLWLHRLSAENPNRQSFSSLMFLEPGEPRRVLAKNLQYWWLLALRIALLVLLALAFAGPAIWRTQAAVAGEDARLHVIVLDSSASMAYDDRWTSAVEAAHDVIDSLRPGDRGQVIAAGRITELLTQVTDDAAVLRAAVDNSAPGIFVLGFGQLMRALDGVVRGAELPVMLHIVTDAQATGLPTPFAELAPREQAELVIHDVGAQAASNWAIETLVGSPLTGELEASVASFADTAAEKTLTLELEGSRVEQETVDLPAHGRARVTFSPLELRAGSNRVAVSMAPGDGLAADDTRYIALQRAVPRPVLLVSDDLRSDDTLFLFSAMDTLAALVVDAETVRSNELAERDLNGYHYVVVMDAGSLDAASAAQLDDYVESGGSVLLAMGPRSAALATVPITGEPVQAGGSLNAEAYTAIGAIDVGHPALRGVEALRAARFYRYINVMPSDGDQTLISLESGAPLLLERELGAGQVLVYTSTLDRQWNDLVVQPVFVPFISGLADHMLGGAGFSNEAELGSSLAVRALGLEGGQIFDTRGDVALGLGGTDDVLLDQIGFYEVVGGGVSRLVAVNFDARESDLTKTDAATLERWQRLGTGPGAPQAGAAAAAEADTLVPIGLWVLALLLLIIVVESWAGNWHLRVRRGMAA
jgi:hypothetical protein